MLTQEFEELRSLTKSSLSEEECGVLFDMAGNRKVLELGAYTGLSTYILSEDAIKITSVDDFRYYDDKDFSSIEEVKKINKEMRSRCDNVTLHEWDIDQWFSAGFCKEGYYDLAFIDSGGERSKHIWWCKCAGIKIIIVHDFKFENKVFEDGLLDWRGDIIYGIWLIRDAIRDFVVNDTLITLYLK